MFAYAKHGGQTFSVCSEYSKNLLFLSKEILGVLGTKPALTYCTHMLISGQYMDHMAVQF
jgi:hypothetical protein